MNAGVARPRAPAMGVVGKPQGFITGSMATVHGPPKLPRDLDRQRTGNSTTPFAGEGRATR
jgi:hypothetical protein